MDSFFYNKHVILNFLVALMICSNSMAVVINSEGIVVLTILVAFSSIIVLNFKEYVVANYSRSLFVTLVVLVLFMITMLFHQELVIQDYFLHFVCFGIPFLFLPITKLKLDKIIHIISLLSFLFLPFYIKFDYGFGLSEQNASYDDGLLMTMSYRIVPFIIANIYVFLSKNIDIKYRLFSGFLFVPYFIILGIIGSRGAQLAVFVFVFFLYIQGSKTKESKIRRSLIIGSLLVVVILSFDTIIHMLYEFFISNDINILAINRLEFVLDNDKSLSSGRNDIFQDAFNDFLSSPLWGTGIGAFDEYKSYPHNLILQILQEGGLLFFIPFFLMFFRGVYEIVLGKSNSYTRILTFVFCAGMIQLFFSFYYWGSQYFWMFVFLVLYKNHFVPHTIMRTTTNVAV